MALAHAPGGRATRYRARSAYDGRDLVGQLESVRTGGAAAKKMARTGGATNSARGLVPARIILAPRGLLSLVSSPRDAPVRDERGACLKSVLQSGVLSRARIPLQDAAIESARPGISETKLRSEIEGVLWDQGADSVDFFAVQSGPESASPHHQASGRQLREGEPVLFDIAARVDGYFADIDVHEPPLVDGGNVMVLQLGMAFTVEPGIYLTGRYGIRIEDTVLITEAGPKRLTRGSRPLQVKK